MAQPSFTGFPLPRAEKRGIIGKQFASGTATSGSVNQTFEELLGTATRTTGGFTVTGLIFKPSIIIAHAPSTADQGWMTVYTSDRFSNLTNPATYVQGQIVTMPYGPSFFTNVNTYGFEANKQASFVNATGFCLPIVVLSATVTWMAYE